jgi:hypothetical protein
MKFVDNWGWLALTRGRIDQLFGMVAHPSAEMLVIFVVDAGALFAAILFLSRARKSAAELWSVNGGDKMCWIAT